MQIRVGYELIYDCPQPIPMILTLNIHYTRVSDIAVPDHLITNPSVLLTAYRDLFGNWCSRIVAPTGQVRLSANAIVNDTGEPDVVAASAQQIPVQDLPEEALVFLLGSRYCETDRLSEAAWKLFGNSPPGWARRASRPSAISSTIISSSVTNTPARPRRPGMFSTRGRASAVITRISPSHSAAV